MGGHADVMLPDGATLWLRGTLLHDPQHHRTAHGREVTYLSVSCSTGVDSLVTVDCRAHGKLSRYCRYRQFAQGDVLWVVGTLHEQHESPGDPAPVVNVLDLTGDTGATWNEDEP